MIKLKNRNLALLFIVGMIVLFQQITIAKINSIHDLNVLDEVHLPDSSTEYTQSDFFTISDFQKTIKKSDHFKNPILLATNFFNNKLSDIDQPISNQAELSLLNWEEQHETSHSIEKYVRQKHFGSWIKDPNYEKCLNTRAQILVKYSIDPVGFDIKNKCRVISGRWADPYTNEEITNADDIQIDHVVPLKNSYINGSWEWTAQERCHYANFTSNTFHLLPVSAHENMSKGDSSPEKYIPPNHEFTCKYIESWLKIKAIWKLRMTTYEAIGIKQLIVANHCQKTEFLMSEEELNQQRELQNTIPIACKKRAR